VTEQVGQPLGVLDVGLAAGHRLDVPRVDDQKLDALVLQNVVDGTPVDAGRLHHRVADAFVLQPGQDLLQVVGHRPEAARLAPL